MTPLPPAYRWISLLHPLPRMMSEAIALLGTIEAPGDRNCPTILEWARETGLSKTYSADSIPWCGLFMGVVAIRAGKPLPPKPLWALDWLKFGVEVSDPGLGDVLIFKRDGGGHVGLYAGEDETAFHVLGGNQSDRVCFSRIARGRLKGVRRPAYINQPSTVRAYALNGAAGLSRNEA